MYTRIKSIAQPPQQVRRAGFTLLEMSIVLVIIGFIIVGAMVVFTQSLSASQLSTTNAKLATIQQTLYNYRVANGRLPCPADVTLPATDQNFGVEALNPGDCIGGSSAPTVSTYDSSTGVRTAQGTSIPTVNFAITTGTAQDMREGMVPTRTLRLPDDYAYDAWGRRFMYAVTKDMTQSRAFNIYQSGDLTTRIRVNNATASPSTTQAAYVLLSFGSNGHGAYPRAGGSTRLSASSGNADEQTNCHCSSSAVAQALAATFVQKDATLDTNPTVENTNYFDDIIVYGTRASMMMQSALYWNIAATGSNNMLCPTSSSTGVSCTTVNGATTCTAGSLTCTTIGSIKSCYCSQ